MKRKTIITVILIVILLLGGIFIIKKAKDKDASAPIAKAYPVVVKTIRLARTENSLTLPYLALTKNDKDVMLASKIAARIEYIRPSGSLVKKGTVIARLDKTGIIGAKKSVKAQLKANSTTSINLETTHQRTLNLLEVGGASIEQSQNEESKLAELASQKEGLNQKINELNSTLSYAIITSPVNGNLSKAMVNTGDIAMPGKPIANITAENGYYLLIRVPAELPIYGVNMNGNSYKAIALNSSFMGLNEYKVYIDNAHFTTGNREEVDVEVYKGQGILLPFDAILNRNGKSYLLLIDGTKATPKEVAILQTGEQGVVIKSEDLEGKEIVVGKQDILLKLLGGVQLQIKND